MKLMPAMVRPITREARAASRPRPHISRDNHNPFIPSTASIPVMNRMLVTSSTIASQATEYDSRDHILNRVVTVTAGVPSGFQAAATSWDVSGLASAWGAP